MQSLLRSMSPDQRAELHSMMEALLRDDRLLVDLAQLASNLDLLLPGGLGDRVPFGGDEPLGLEGALDQIARLQAMDRLADQLSDVESTGDLAAIDRDEVRDLLGDDAVRDLEALDDLAAPARGGRLPDPRRRAAGAHAAGQPADRPEGPRRPVRPAPARRVRRPPDRPRRAGRGARRDDQAVRVRRPVPPRPARDAVQRARPRGERARPRGRHGRPAGPPRRRRDFEVHRTEQMTQTSTVLLVDMSRSMLLRGCFLAAKKVAVALDTLIRTQYPRDHLAVIGFAYYAREIRPGALAELTWHGYEYGTNLQHGLLLARRILERNPGGQQGDRGHHRRRADRPLRGRPGRVQLPADAADDPGDPPRGAALHEGGDHDQHVHARAVAGAGRVRRAHDPAQPRPGVLRRRPSTSASTSSSTSSAGGRSTCRSPILQRRPAREVADRSGGRAVDRRPVRRRSSCSCTSWARSSPSGRPSPTRSWGRWPARSRSTRTSASRQVEAIGDRLVYPLADLPGDHRRPAPDRAGRSSRRTQPWLGVGIVLYLDRDHLLRSRSSAMPCTT